MDCAICDESASVITGEVILVSKGGDFIPAGLMGELIGLLTSPKEAVQKNLRIDAA